MEHSATRCTSTARDIHEATAPEINHSKYATLRVVVLMIVIVLDLCEVGSMYPCAKLPNSKKAM